MGDVKEIREEKGLLGKAPNSPPPLYLLGECQGRVVFFAKEQKISTPTLDTVRLAVGECVTYV